MTAYLRKAAFFCCLALPVALLHARALADILMVTTGLLFLLDLGCPKTPLPRLREREGPAAKRWEGEGPARSEERRPADANITPFALSATAWWLWLCLCSAIGTGGLGLALAAIRLPLFSIAAAWALQEEARRRALWWVLGAAAAWIALQSWEQQLTGTNLFGHGRYMDGALTGPFAKPRAGPALILIFFPLLVPSVSALLAHGRRLAALGLAALAVLTMVLIGQRMPAALMLLGLAASALLLPSLRPAVLLAAACGAVVLAAAPVVSPGTYAKLVVQTRDQVTHFWRSDYGLLWAHGAALAEAHPLHGLGLDGFRRVCAGVETGGCNLHPHNIYIEAADDAGWVGLALFSAMAVSILVPLARGLWRHPEPLRVGLFAGALVAFWPLATTSAFTSLPNAGWIFLLAGLGFSCGAAPGREKESNGDTKITKRWLEGAE